MIEVKLPKKTKEELENIHRFKMTMAEQTYEARKRASILHYDCMGLMRAIEHNPDEDMQIDIKAYQYLSKGMVKVGEAIEDLHVAARIMEETAREP